MKNRFDTRSWVEIVEELKTERTLPGDSVKLLITYNGTSKPQVCLEFMTTDPEKKKYDSLEDITDWLPDKPYYDVLDDTTGKPMEGEFRRGSDWLNFIDSDFGPVIQKIFKSGGRAFSYEVKQ